MHGAKYFVACLVSRRLSVSLSMKICPQMKARREETGFASPLPPSHGPLCFVTSHARLALAPTKQIRDTFVLPRGLSGHVVKWLISLFRIFPISKSILRIAFIVSDQAKMLRPFLKTMQSLTKRICRWQTCFLKPTEGGLYGYTPVWENDGELLRLIQDTVLFGRNILQDTGRVEATYNFERCIGVYSSFRNGIDASAGFKITPIYTIKMVYIPTESEDTIIGISAYPSFDPRQQSCWNDFTIIATL